MDNTKIAAHILQLGDQDQYVRWSAATALGQIGVPAIPILLETFKDDRLNVRL